MNLELRFFATFREAVGARTIEWEAGDDATIDDVLHAVTAEYPELDVFTDTGEIREFVSVLHNGRNVLHDDGLATRLEDGDRVALFPPVAGG